MMVDIKKFYYISCNKLELTISNNIFNHGLLPILWFNQGLYGLIPAALIANTRPLFPKLLFKFTWDQTIEISQEVGKLLSNQQFNGQTNDSSN